jgi:DNA-binding protein YbaB
MNMPCDSTLNEGQTLQERMTQVQQALARLEASLTSGNVKVTIGANGAVAFTGWKDRDNVTDVCGYRTLSASNSWALRQAVARAEAMSGRKVNASAVAVGTHSHDGGSTWHKGH